MKIEILSKEKLSELIAEHKEFIGGDDVAAKLDLSYYEIDDADFSNLDMQDLYFQKSVLLNSQFTSCSLRDAKFDNAILKSCDFRNSDLHKVDFIKCEIFGCNFSYADLERTNFIECVIENRNNFV